MKRIISDSQWSWWGKINSNKTYKTIIGNCHAFTTQLIWEGFMYQHWNIETYAAHHIVGLGKRSRIVPGEGRGVGQGEWGGGAQGGGRVGMGEENERGKGRWLKMNTTNLYNKDMKQTYRRWSNIEEMINIWNSTNVQSNLSKSLCFV